jgi:hypothetical protein
VCPAYSTQRQKLLEDAPNAQLIHLLNEPSTSPELQHDICLELRFRLEELLCWVEAEVDAR